MGFAEYSRSFQFFRQVCEPPPHPAATSHSRESEFQQSLVGSCAVPPGGTVEGKKNKRQRGFNCLFLSFYSLPPLQCSLWVCRTSTSCLEGLAIFTALSLAKFINQRRGLLKHFFFSFSLCHASYITVEGSR